MAYIKDNCKLKFINNGPDIPNNLFEAHKEGRVVFFCGAGISFNAGLKGFGWLVDKLLDKLGKDATPLIKRALKDKRYDIAIDLLEKDYPGGRFSVRKELIKILKPDIKKKGSFETHKALLDLSSDQDGQIRLVTTNFDQLFEISAKDRSPEVKKFNAPYLPIPKKNKWDGLVYLHGLLPNTANEKDLNQLVLSSGDFGLAYLTERWAARFVTELFRNYIVCFVGYSIDDPIIRYMMDALAADRMMGEKPLDSYAFCAYKTGKENSVKNEWEAKGVTPILYEWSRRFPRHNLLHKTLKAWAYMHKQGLKGLEEIILNSVLIKPTLSTVQDDSINRFLWAISEKTGKMAKLFAEFNPVPAFEWFDELIKPAYGVSDFIRFGISPNGKTDSDFQFNIFRRPAPTNLADYPSFMGLTYNYEYINNWDEVLKHISRWLLRYINNPKVILWLTSQNGELHPQFIRLLESKLHKLAKMEKEGRTKELEELRKNAPESIPTNFMIRLWRLFIDGQIHMKKSRISEYDLSERLKNEEFSFDLHVQLRKFLSPKIKLDRQYSLSEKPTKSLPPIRYELSLDCGYLYNTLHHNKADWWQKILPLFFFDAQQLLIDAMNLHKYVNNNEVYDFLNFDMPSISEHSQNQNRHNWILLIEIVRDAWLIIKEQDPIKAKKIAVDWFDSTFVVFKRLALFAASFDDIIPSELWVEWVLADNSFALWNFQTGRELYRLLVLQGCALTNKSQNLLEKGICRGPHQNQDGSDETDKQKYRDNEIWLRLAKLRLSKKLGEDAESLFQNLTEKYPNRKLASDESDEFVIWRSFSTHVRRNDSSFDELPEDRMGLVDWIKKHIDEKNFSILSDWSNHCRKNPKVAGLALFEVIQEENIPINLSRELFYAWSSSDELCLETWECFSIEVSELLKIQLQNMYIGIAHWLNKCAMVLNSSNETLVIKICKKMLNLSINSDTGIQLDGDPIDQPVTEAINHPIGKITEAIISIYFKTERNDNEGLPEAIRLIFTKLCNIDRRDYRHGRVILASQVISLFRIDGDWTRQNLIPLFDWSRSSEDSRCVWEGFLWSPQMYLPVISLIKEDLIKTVEHYQELNEFDRQFVMFITFLALDYPDVFSKSELISTFNNLPQQGLEESLDVILQSLKSHETKPEKYWEEKVKPFWSNYWPKSRKKINSHITEIVAQICIESREAFQDSYTTLSNWLVPLEYPTYVLIQLLKFGHCKRFPYESLMLIDAIIETPTSLSSNELEKCLSLIRSIDSSLEDSSQFKRLNNLIQ